ncbi:MAG: TetR/AcrR family transcriptional regulator [Silicimonas sp.]|nr:TetR/AcrR family transcriptional regulator [Silicimonas sp.]
MPEDKAAIIVDGAFELLMDEGLPHLSYSRIADTIGIPRQLIRYYFADPDDLMLALCDKIAAVYREALIQGMNAFEGDNRVGLFMDFYFDLLEAPRKPRDDQVYDALMSLAARSDRIKGNLRQQYNLLGHVVSHEIRQQYDNIPLPVCEQISFVFVSLMYGHWKMVASLGLNEDHKHITRQAIDRLLESYRRNPEPAPCKFTWKDAD